MSETMEEVLQGKWRKLTAKEFEGQWGCELMGSVGGEDRSGQTVELTRGDGQRSRFRLVKCVSRRKGKLRPLYAMEKLPKEEPSEA